MEPIRDLLWGFLIKVLPSRLTSNKHLNLKRPQTKSWISTHEIDFPSVPHLIEQHHHKPYCIGKDPQCLHVLAPASYPDSVFQQIYCTLPLNISQTPPLLTHYTAGILVQQNKTYKTKAVLRMKFRAVNTQFLFTDICYLVIHGSPGFLLLFVHTSFRSWVYKRQVIWSLLKYKSVFL